MTSKPRQRVRLDRGWRFRRVDSVDVDHRLDYEPRPEPGVDQDGKDADARPELVAPTGEAGKGLKPWILPTGNQLVDPSRRVARPAQQPEVAPSAADPGLDDSDWDEVDVPHDWAIAGPFLVDGPYGGMGRLPSWGVGWYRRPLEITEADAGRSIFLDVDGAMSYATVWLNGTLVGGWPYGYNSWRVDLTPHLNPGGSNLLAIRLDNPARSARWYPGGGLFRDVWLVKASRLHVAQWGTRVTTPQVTSAAALIEFDVSVENSEQAAADVDVCTEFFELTDADSPGEHPVARTARIPIRVPKSGLDTVRTTTTIQNPALWGPPPTQRPNLYLALTTLRRDDVVVDRYETRFGIRSVEFDPGRGVRVNGEHVRVQGVNNHHDLGSLGAAFHRRAAERQLEILAEMGTNALRMAHNPPAPELLELADRMGFLVLDEVFDCWQRGKTELDFHLIFDDWHEQDLRAMIRRDRNHPSVIIWGIGNEVGEQYTDDDGARVASRLADIARGEDPTRPITSAMNYAKPDMPLPAELDVIGLNYQGEGIRQEREFDGTDKIRTPPLYDAFHRTHPDKIIIGTETASAVSSRGVYLFPVTPAQSASVRDGRGGDPDSHQVSGYELHAVEFGSSADKVFATQDAHDYVAGEFVWTGFDYLGEPTPYYTARSSYTGIVDLAGFGKDRFWLYRSRWRPDVPMAHIVPHWTWPGREGLLTPVHVFTSGDEGELYLNGRSMGRRRKGIGEHRLRWDSVRYEPGELTVISYRGGALWARQTVRTAGPPDRLVVDVDRAVIAADGHDLAFITVGVEDASGVPVPTADLPVSFSLTGPADLVATDNGDPTDMTAFPSPVRKLFSGHALAIIRSRAGVPGDVGVAVRCDGLDGATARVVVDTSPRSV